MARNDKRRYRDDRDFLERLGDEIKSWLGDEGAERRRGRDERDDQGEYDRGYQGDYPRREHDHADHPVDYQERAYERPHARGDYGQDYYDPSDYGREYRYAREGRAHPYRHGGAHSGRGPKGYRRSDEKILEEVSERLERHGHIDAGDIEVSVENGEVTLRGTVDSRRSKRLAEDVAESAYGVKDVHNQLRIQERTTSEAVAAAKSVDEL